MGSTLVRTVGTTDTYQVPGLSYSGIGYGQRSSFRLSNGNFLYLVGDRNQSATAGQGDNTGVSKVHVYERNFSTNVVTLRASITVTGIVGEVSGALFSNNDLAIVWNNGGQGVEWNKIFYAKLTYVGYGVSSIETAVDRSGDGDNSLVLWKTKFFDVDVTDDGAVMVFWKQDIGVAGLAAPYASAGVYTSLACRTTGGSWVNTVLIYEDTSPLAFNSTLTFESVTGCALGGTATARRFVYASSHRRDSAMPFQSQFWIGRGTLNTSTGAVSALNLELGMSSFTAGYPNNYGHSCSTKAWRKDASSDSYVIGHANTTGWGLARGTWDGTTHTFQQPFEMRLWSGGSQALGQDYVYADLYPNISYSPDKLIFWSMGQDAPGNRLDPASGVMSTFKLNSTIVHLDQSTTALVTSGFEGKGNGTWTGLDAIGSNGNRNYTVDSHEILVQYGQGAGSTVQAIWQKVPAPSGGSGILSLSPANAATNVPAQPNLSGQIDTDVGIDFTMYRIQYQFATNNTFSTGLIDYTEPVGNGVPQAGKPSNIPTGFLKEVSFTDQAGVTKAFSNTLPVSAGSLAGGVWYYRARLVNEVGQVGAWTSTNSFTIGHPPVTIPLAPGGSKYYMYGAGSVDFSWQFTDPSSTDFQTAYQVIVRNEVTAATIFDTGKLTSANKFHTGTVAVGNKDVLLSWQVKTWDSDNVAGVYSDKVYFYLTDPPVVTITAPTAGSTQATPRPNITFNVTTSGARTVTEATIVVSQAGQPLWSKRIQIGAASGVSRTVRVDAGILQDGQSYSVQVSAADSQGLKSLSGLISFTADWTPPAAPASVAVSISHYNTEAEGWVEVTWSNSANDANFVYYIIYRRDDLINPYTGAVLATGATKVVGYQYGSSPTNTFKDYTAPSNYKVNYLIHQVAQVNTVEIESTNSTYTTVQPVTDGYWLITTDDQGNTIDAFKLSIVTGDSYTNEQEEAEFIIQGRGRVVNKGQVSGMKGSLDAQLRDTGIYTARQKKQKIETIAEGVGNLFLRTPFGDIFRVNVSQVAMTRIAGVGGAEFCDASIPYSEVSV